MWLPLLVSCCFDFDEGPGSYSQAILTKVLQAARWLAGAAGIKGGEEAMSPVESDFPK